MPQVFLGDSALVPTAEGGSGSVVDRGGEAFYRIENYHVMPPFFMSCLLYTSPSPRDQRGSRMPSSA